VSRPRQDGRRRLFRTLGLALLIALSGCTALQLGYNNADTYLHWRGSQYFGFEDEQKADFEHRVQRFMAWHRRSELPRYGRMAEELAVRLSRGVSQADLVWGYDSFQTHLKASLVAGAAEMAALLDGLTPEQLARFRERLDKENRDFAKEHGLGEAPQERRALRVKRNIDRMEDWFGSLADAQVERIAQYSKRAPLDNELRLKERKRFQAELLGMAARKEARKRLANLAAEWDKHRDPAYEAMREENLREYYSMLLDLDKTLTSEQRAKAVKRLRGFAADFAALSAPVSAR
jgi:hypothetical protein